MGAPQHGNGRDEATSTIISLPLAQPRLGGEEVNGGPSELKRCFPDDLESKRQRALEAMKLYGSQPLNDAPMIAEGTRVNRERTWVKWIS